MLLLLLTKVWWGDLPELRKELPGWPLLSTEVLTGRGNLQFKGLLGKFLTKIWPFFKIV